MELRKGCCINPYSCRQNYILCIYTHIVYVFPGIGFFRFYQVFRRVHDHTSVTSLNTQEMLPLCLISYLAKGRPGCRGGRTSLTTGGGAIHSCILLSIQYDGGWDSGLRFGVPLREIQRTRLASTWGELEWHVVYLMHQAFCCQAPPRVIDTKTGPPSTVRDDLWLMRGKHSKWSFTENLRAGWTQNRIDTVSEVPDARARGPNGYFWKELGSSTEYTVGNFPCHLGDWMCTLRGRMCIPNARTSHNLPVTLMLCTLLSCHAFHFSNVNLPLYH